MLYNSYVKRIEMLARVRDALYRLRYIILSALAVILACVIAYLIVKGNFSGGVTLADNEIEYGDSLSYEAKALFSDVYFQFKAQNEAEWSDFAPKKLGSYEIRAVSEGSFGREKYSSPTAYTIVPRRIEVAAADSIAVYGDTPSFAAFGLVYGDKLTGYDFVFVDRTENGVTVKVKEGSVSICDKEGNDILSAYSVSCPERDVGFVPRELVIETDGARKIYDGKPLVNPGIRFSEYTPFAYEDRAGESLLKAVGTITDAGTVKNTADFSALKIFNSDGADVTKFYKIVTDCGNLKITKRKITVTTGSAFMWFEEGKALSCSEFELTDGDLVFGHKLLLDGDAPEITEPQIADNSLKVKVVDANGDDVTRNYDIDYIYGKLEIQKKIQVVLTPYPLIQVYNGKPVTYKNNGWWHLTGEPMRDGDYYEIEAVLSGSRTDVGVSDGFAEIISAKFFNSDGEELECYELSAGVGIIQVTPAYLEICSTNITSDVKDSLEILTSRDELYIGNNSVLPYGFDFECINPYKKTFIWLEDEGGFLIVTEDSHGIETSRTQIYGTEIEVFNSVGDIRVKDASGKDVTENFDIGIYAGIIKVIKH